MKFLTVASLLTLSSSALAAIRQVQLFAQSDNEEINQFGISSQHEGAGINYLFLAAPGVAATLQFDDETNSIFTELNTEPPARQSLVIAGNVVQLSVAGEPLNVQIAEDGLVSFPGSDAIAAAKNINDPYRYSEEQFAVVTNGAEGSIPFQIYAKFVGKQEEVSPSVVAPETTGAPVETPAYTNKTVVTVFTTYCPEFTTLTVTVCKDVCTPTEIATSGYVTIPEVKVPTSTEFAAVNTTLETVTKAPITSAPAPAPTPENNTTSTVYTPVATVTSYEGSANIITGSFAIGVAAVVGMIL